MDDPRTTFHLVQDKKVIVYFEWSGPIGPHKFEGLWKNTEGKVVLISDFEFAATAPQFSGYWSMLLSGAEMPGVWTLDARIDGESAGSLSFQLVAEPGTEPVSRAPVRQPLTPSDLYQKAALATVYIDKIDSKEKAITRGSGFFLDDGRLITAFQNIDGASKVRVIFPNGRALDVTQVNAFNRWQDWAILPAPASGLAGLPRAQAKSWSVGALCYYLETSTGSSRIISDTSIVGANTCPRAGDRLNLSGSPNRGAVGSPLLNEFGEVVGMMGGSLAPGTDLLESYLLVGSPGGIVRDGLAVPVTLIPPAPDQTAPVTFEDLARTGQMLPLLIGADRVEFGQFSLNLVKGQGTMSPNNGRQQFTHQDQKFYVYVNWASNFNFKGNAIMAVFDGDNHSLGQAKPLKLSLKSGGGITSSSWDVPVTTLPVGVYRVDVSLGTDTVWRRFFRVTN